MTARASAEDPCASRFPDDDSGEDEVLDEGPFPDGWRPRVRADCALVPRPCPFVACRYNNYCFISQGGKLKFAFRKRGATDDGPEPHEIPPEASCVLDVAERGGMKLEAIGELYAGLTRERIRQIEKRAFQKLRGKSSTSVAIERLLREFDPEPEPSCRTVGFIGRIGRHGPMRGRGRR